jgi:hypothetical protein
MSVLRAGRFARNEESGPLIRRVTRRPFRFVVSVSAVAAIALCSLAIGDADAAGPWSDPVKAAAGVAQTSQPAISFASRGGAVLSWRVIARDGQLGSTDRRGAHVLATRAPGGQITVRGRFRDDVFVPVAYGRGRIAVLRERLVRSDRDRGRRVQLGVSFGNIGRALGPVRRLATYWVPAESTPRVPTVAVNRRGDVAVAWVEYRQPDLRRPGVNRMRVAIGRQAGFKRPITVAGTRAGHPILAYGDDGEVLLAFTTIVRVEGDAILGVVKARTRRANGAFGPPQTLGPITLGAVDLRAAVARDGLAAVAWAGRSAGEGIEGHWEVRAAVRRPGELRLGTAQLLDPAPVAYAATPGPVRVVLSRNDTVTVGWAGFVAEEWSTCASHRPTAEAVLAQTAT